MSDKPNHIGGNSDETSHVSRLTSHVSRLTSHVSRHNVARLAPRSLALIAALFFAAPFNAHATWSADISGGYDWEVGEQITVTLPTFTGATGYGLTEHPNDSKTNGDQFVPGVTVMSTPVELSHFSSTPFVVQGAPTTIGTVTYRYTPLGPSASPADMQQFDVRVVAATPTTTPTPPPTTPTTTTTDNTPRRKDDDDNDNLYLAAGVATVAAIWWKKRNPKGRLQFNALPTSTESMLAEVSLQLTDVLTADLTFDKFVPKDVDASGNQRTVLALNWSF